MSTATASNTMSQPNNWRYDPSRRRNLFVLALVLAFTALFSTAAFSALDPYSRKDVFDDHTGLRLITEIDSLIEISQKEGG